MELYFDTDKYIFWGSVVPSWIQFNPLRLQLWEDKLIQSKVLETEKPMPHILNINAAGQQQLQIGQAGGATQQQAAKQAQPQGERWRGVGHYTGIHVGYLQ